MATMNASEVTVGSALTTGAIFIAPEGTTLPANAEAQLGNAFKLLGFTSDSGVQIAESSSTESIRAWEGRLEVFHVRTEYTESVAFMPIQCNADVAKLTWGDDMVDVDATSGAILAKHHGAMLKPVVIVIETAPRDGIIKRYCGTFQLTERGEITLDGTQSDGRQLTFNSIPDSNGVTMYEHTAYTDED